MNKRIGHLLSAFVLAGILALCLTATAVLAAPNGALAVADDGGADDVSGNLDLNHLTFDASQQANPGLIGATWTWDVTALPPGETATGCAAFDSSGDGKANKMLCATLAISPTPSITATVVYACDSSDPVICGAAAAQAPAGATTCAATLTSDNFGPRANPEASDAQDTQIACTVDTADVSGGYLINVCSYSSESPTAAPVDCLFDPAAVAFLIIAKDASGITDPFDFTLTPAARNGDSAFSVNGGSRSAPIPINVGTNHVLSESLPTGWLLTSAECNTLAGAVGGFDSNSHSATNLNASVGQTLVCTFHNDPPGRIVVQTTTDRPGNYTFDFAPDYTAPFSLTDGDSHDSGPLPPSVTYAVMEMAPLGWTVDATCTGNVDPASITLTAGTVVTCTFANVAQAAGINVNKSATPTKINMGDTVLYQYVVTATQDSALLDNITLTDDTCGPPIGFAGGDTSNDGLLDVGETWIYSCSTIVNADTTNTVVVTATTPLSDVVQASDTAFVDVKPNVTLTKVADANSRPEPNASFVYTLTIDNKSNESVVIDSLTDDYPLSQQCLDLIGDTIPAKGIVKCSYTKVHADVGVYNNTASVTVRDNENNQKSDSANESVTVTNVNPTFLLAKTVAPTTLPEPNAIFTYTLTITNTSVENVTIKNITDDNPLSPACQNLDETVLAPQQVVSCQYTVTHAEPKVYPNTATVLVRDNENNPKSVSANASVTVSDVKPTFLLTKNVDFITRPEPNATFTYTLTITNTSVENVTIKNITDDNPLSQACLNLDETILVPRQVVSCQYTATFAQLGDHTNTAEVQVRDNEGNNQTERAEATVTVTNVPASISADKIADPTVLTAPGGAVDFTVTVTNTSAVDSVVLDELVEDADNDGNPDTTYTAGSVCAATTLAPGVVTTCTFSRVVIASAGEVITDTVTVTGVDDDGGAVSAIATATVAIYRADALVVSKIPSTSTIPEPGGSVTFTIGVLNVHPVAGVKLSALTDSAYGNVTTTGHDGISATTCTLPTVPAGDQYVCTFTAAVNGNANAVHSNTITVNGSNVLFGNFSGQAATQVTVSDLPSSLSVTKTPSRSSVPEAGANVTFTLQVRNTSVADPLVINSISDSVYGNVANNANPLLVNTDCTTGKPIAPGATYSCHFTALIGGAIGTQHGDVVTVKATDDEGVQRQATASAFVTVVGARALATKRDGLAQDANNNGVANPGDVISYTITLSNTGNTAGSFLVSDVLDTNLALVAGTVDASQGAVTTTANGFSVAINALPPGNPAVITYQARVKNPLAAGVTKVSNQATVTSPTAPTVVTDDPDTLAANDATTTLVVAAPALALTKRDALADDVDQDGIASPGDLLAYKLILTNSGNQAASNVVIEDSPDGNTSLVSGSVATTQGVVTSGNGAGDMQVKVELSSPLAVGASVTVDFNVTVKSQLPLGLAELSNQALVRASGLSPAPSDDPDTPAAGDPTVTTVSARPKVDMFKNDSLLVDADEDGVPSPGDTLAYNIEVVSKGSQNASALLLRDIPGSNLTLIPGSVTRSQGDILSGNDAGDKEVLIDLGTLEGNTTATVSFQAVIANPLPAGVVLVSNQASLSGENFEPILSDDPATGALDDATQTTVTATPVLRVSKRDLLYRDVDGDEAVGPGDILYYLLQIINTGNVAATEVILTDAPSSQTTLQAGTIQLSQGNVTTGNGSSDTAVAVNLGTIPANATVNVAFRVVISEDATISVSNQAVVEYVNPNAAVLQVTSVKSDDPDTAAVNDPTVTPLKGDGEPIAPLHLPLVFD